MAASRTIRQKITEWIRGEVMAGQFSAGQPLREVEFARRFGVSRGPVRDAFLQLAQEGLLAYEANRGVRVREMPKPENRPFIVSLRSQIEVYAVETGLSQVDDERLDPVKRRLDELGEACQQAHTPTVAQADMALHQALLEACGVDDLLPSWKQLCVQMMFTYTRLDSYEEVFAEHQAIVDAAEAGEKESLVAALHQNLR